MLVEMPPSSRADANAPARSTPFSRFGGPAGRSAAWTLWKRASFSSRSCVDRTSSAQPGVLDRDGRLAREQREDLDVALAEGVELGAFQIDDTDAAVLEQERNRQLDRTSGTRLI